MNDKPTTHEELLAACKVCVSTIDNYCLGEFCRKTIHMRAARHLAQNAIERCENE